MAELKLRNCPFCGKRGRIKRYSDERYRAVCENYLCPVESFDHHTEQEAKDWWNKRADNDCTDDDTAEWIDKEVRGTMTNVCSACGSCSVYPDKYCGGCGRSMKNGY